MNKFSGAASAAALIAALAPAGAFAQDKPAELNIGITTYSSGAASVFGVPARHAAEMLAERINAEGGIDGVPIKLHFIDEGAGLETLLTEYRRLVEDEGMDVMFASISSGVCNKIAPLAEDLEVINFMWDCGTQRILEDDDYDYVFRTQANATPEVLAPLAYLLKHHPEFKTLAVVNQDYAWGRDSWEIFQAALKTQRPDVEVVAELFPAFGAADFSAEVSRLQALQPDVILSTSWGGDLDTFVRQAGQRGLFDQSLFVLPLAESSLQRLGDSLPEGAIVGARGDHWNNHPKPKDPEAMRRFVEGYRQRFNEYPIYPCHHMAQAFSALQGAYAKAIQAKKGWPNDAELADAFRGLTFDSPTSTITLREDGQGLEDQLVGLSSHGDRFPFAVPRDMVIFPATMVSAPVGQKSVDWLKTLKPDILAQVPAAIAG